MARKLFISFLGFTNYWECVYSKDDFTSNSVRYIQEATLDYLNRKNPWSADDVALFLLTEGAESKNWVDNGHTDRNGNVIQQTGLHTQLGKMNLPFRIEIISKLPNGNNEKEIIEIFSRVYDYIQPDDEIYFDVTHGFRSLPMLTLVLGNYAKFLKNISVKSITYGQFDPGTGKATIVDLLPLSDIQDWTFASADFLENGNVNKLAALSEREYRAVLKQTMGKDDGAKQLRRLTECLKKMVCDFQTCRGMNIFHSTNIDPLKRELSNLKSTFIEPLNPVLEKINVSMNEFDSAANVKNGFQAAKWCMKNGLYQQACTILQENIVTFFALRHEIKIDDEDNRELINSAFVILFNNLSREKWNMSDERKNMLDVILRDKLLSEKDIVNGFNNLSEVRNDLNHSGMRSKREPLEPANIQENIRKCVNLFEEKLCTID